MSSPQLISWRIYIGLCCCCCCCGYLPLAAATAKRSARSFSAVAAPVQTAQTLDALSGLHDTAVGRRKRQADDVDADADDYDENADVIPDLQQPTEEQLRELAAQIAEGFGRMWQSLVDMVKFCLEAIGQIFDGNAAGSSSVGRYLDYGHVNEPPPSPENR